MYLNFRSIHFHVSHRTAVPRNHVFPATLADTCSAGALQSDSAVPIESVVSSQSVVADHVRSFRHFRSGTFFNGQRSAASLLPLCQVNDESAAAAAAASTEALKCIVQLNASAGVSICKEFESSNLALNTRLAAEAQSVFHQFASGEPCMLDRQAMDVGRALEMSSSFSVLFSSRPFTAYAAKPLGKRRTLVIFLLWTGLAIFFCYQVMLRGRGHFNGPRLRIRKADGLGDLLPANKSGIIELGLLYDGCNTSTALVGIDGGRELHGDALANGYFFSAEAETLGWAIEASDGNESFWQPVGVCSWVTVTVLLEAGLLLQNPTDHFVSCSKGVVSINLKPHSYSAAQVVQFRVDYRPDILSILITLGIIIFPAGWFCSLVAIYKGCFGSYKYILGTTMLLFGTWATCWGLVALSYGFSLLKIAHLYLSWNAVTSILTGVLFIFMERNLVIIFFVIGLVFFLQVLALLTVFYQSNLNFVFTYEGPAVMNLFLSVYLMVGGVIFVWFRWRALEQAKSLLVQDQKRYEEMWNTILETQQNDIQLLKQVVPSHLVNVKPPRQMALDFGSKYCRQTAHKKSLHAICSSYFQVVIGVCQALCSFKTAGSDLQEHCQIQKTSLNSRSTLLDTAIARRLLLSLDQLFVQASCLEPILLCKVKQWAAANTGYFPTKPDEGGRIQFVRYFENGDTEIGLRIKLCHLKSPSRAIEKLVRSYGQDASRLLDVCRQAIMFESINDMVMCLQGIMQDEDIEVLRIKNRYDPSYDASTSGGYRDININLCFRSLMANLLGLDTHVCEVQLVLCCIAALKNEEGHGHYVTCRNLRGE